MIGLILEEGSVTGSDGLLLLGLRGSASRSVVAGAVQALFAAAVSSS